MTWWWRIETKPRDKRKKTTTQESWEQKSKENTNEENWKGEEKKKKEQDRNREGAGTAADAVSDSWGVTEKRLHTFHDPVRVSGDGLALNCHYSRNPNSTVVRNVLAHINNIVLASTWPLGFFFPPYWSRKVTVQVSRLTRLIWPD